MKTAWHDAGLAGRWYPSSASELQHEVDDLLDAASPGLASTEVVSGLIVPHAGYMYSGRAAGQAYAAVRQAAYDRVVVLGPSHYAAFHGAAVLNGAGFHTPLGKVGIDQAAVEQLGWSPLVHDDPTPFAVEHSIEIQLPFLQRALPQARVVPVLIGRLARAELNLLAALLRQLDGPQTLFVISSDFTHYGHRFDYLPFPASDAATVRAALRQLDLGAVAAICSGDVARFETYVATTQATICGRMPISLFLALDAGASEAEMLAYYTSLDVTGDYEHCVSYASLRFQRRRS